MSKSDGNLRFGVLLTHEECYFLYKCRILLTHYSGETFTCGYPTWHTFAGIPVESECYCERLRVLVRFSGVRYQAPIEYSTMYGTAATMRGFILDGTAISAAKADVCILELDEIVPDDELADKMRELVAQCVREKNGAILCGPHY